MKSHSYEIKVKVAKRPDGLFNLCICDSRDRKIHIAILSAGFDLVATTSTRVHDLIAALKIDLAELKPGKTYRF